MELMKTTATLSSNYNVMPFEIFNQDVDEVIMLINFYSRLADSQEEKPMPTVKQKNFTKKPERIRVNDKTATGGWY